MINDRKSFYSHSPPSISDSCSLPVIICCTSGTSGPPKGVQVSHALLTYQLTAFASKYGRIFFSFTTLDWMTGIMALSTSLLYGYTRVITTESFFPELMIEIIREHKVNSLLSSTSVLAFMARYQEFRQDDLDSVTDWMVGGSFVAKELCDEMNLKLRNGRVHLIYGSSECGGLISRDMMEYDSVGLLVPGISVKITDDHGAALGPNERGEICIRTMIPMLGYYKNDEATVTSFFDSWWFTGDMGYVNQEGRLHIVGRKKEILKYNGYQVNPSEIEEIIQAIPGVSLVSVVGLPDRTFGHLPAAVILRTETGNDLKGDQVIKTVEKSLSSPKWLRGGVFFVKQMPMTGSGKVLKRVLMEQILNGTIPTD